MTAIANAALAAQTSVVVAVLPHSSAAHAESDNALHNWQNHPAVLDHDTPPRPPPPPAYVAHLLCFAVPCLGQMMCGPLRMCPSPTSLSFKMKMWYVCTTADTPSVCKLCACAASNGSVSSAGVESACGSPLLRVGAPHSFHEPQSRTASLKGTCSQQSTFS
jgi:hypothetical protein